MDNSILNDLKKLRKIIPNLGVHHLAKFYPNIPDEQFKNRLIWFLRDYCSYNSDDEEWTKDIASDLTDIEDILPNIPAHVIKDKLCSVSNLHYRKLVATLMLIQENYSLEPKETKERNSGPRFTLTEDPDLHPFPRLSNSRLSLSNSKSAENSIDRTMPSKTNMCIPVAKHRSGMKTKRNLENSIIAHNMPSTSIGKPVAKHTDVMKTKIKQELQDWNHIPLPSNSLKLRNSKRVESSIDPSTPNIYEPVAKHRDVMETKLKQESSIDQTMPSTTNIYEPVAKHKDVMETEIKQENATSSFTPSLFENNNPVVENEGAAAALFVDEAVDIKLYYHLMEIFPEACTNYLKRLCLGKEYSMDVVNYLISLIAEDDYPKRSPREKSPEKNLDFDERYELLQQILPDADPKFLRSKLEYFGNDPESYKNFITECLEKKDYPTMKDYLRKRRMSAQVKQYISEFSIENFLKIIPSPSEYYLDKNRKNEIQKYSNDSYFYAHVFLKNRYSHLRIRDINRVYDDSETLTQACQKLDKLEFSMKCRRKQIEQETRIQNIPLLQEIAYLTHKNEIETYIKQKQFEKEQERSNAKKQGLLLTCTCCFDDEIMVSDSANCEKGCVFCKTCIKRSVEISFGEGKLDFSCMASCDSFFTLQTLQIVLDPKVFSKLAQKKQLEEIKAAGVEDLEMCPFCDFATIPAQGDKIFHCLNPECMIESCRICKETSHIPLRCEEIEKDEDVKKRVYVEDKMTEALLRKCYKCGLKFIKEDGCNKMTCSCGAFMCYVCGQPVKDYKHFNGVGGDRYQLCPLYSDTNELHKNDVLKGATMAKAEIGEGLKSDPSSDIQTHYDKKPKNGKEAEMLRLVAEARRVDVQLAMPRINHLNFHH